MEKKKILETSLVLTTGFLIIYLLGSKEIFLYLALAFGLTGIFIKPLAKLITFLWFKLADALNFVMSRLILAIVFFAILYPISIMQSFFSRDKMYLRKSVKSTWVERNYSYKKADLENIW
jgi:hypothetical protein